MLAACHCLSLGLLCHHTVWAGATLMKYNLRDGKSAPRWVKVWGDKICWGDVRTKVRGPSDRSDAPAYCISSPPWPAQDCKSELKLPEATAILHGAKSAAFFKQQGAKKDQVLLRSLIVVVRSVVIQVVPC